MSCGGGGKGGGGGSCSSNAIKYVLGLVQIFDNFASKDADKTHLSKSELKELLQQEFPGFLSGECKPEEVNKIMAALDADSDGQVDITEYFVTLCSLGIHFYESKACKK